MTDTTDASALAGRLRRGERQLWLNPAIASTDEILPGLPLTLHDLLASRDRIAAWAPSLAHLFPDLGATSGVIESPLDAMPTEAGLWGCEVPGRVFIKADHALPVVGSIKARGGMFEVLSHAEDLARDAGLPTGSGTPDLAGDAMKRLTASRTVAVGSTGNLGMSIGIISAALGFNAVVHMSHDAKAWKKQRLRTHGVTVVEHAGDYAAAVVAGRGLAAQDPLAYFVDDENSTRLFLGYATAALRLREQLDAHSVRVGRDAPLFVYLPCGVGGAPGGITFGLKHVFGDHVHCFFAEPVASPACLIGLAFPGENRSAYNFGLDNRTLADGLAVAQASDLVLSLVGRLVSGVYTVADAELLSALARLFRAKGIKLEPSAAAGMMGPGFLLGTPSGRTYLAAHGITERMNHATHVVWTTGGALVPDEEFSRYLAAAG